MGGDTFGEKMTSPSKYWVDEVMDKLVYSSTCGKRKGFADRLFMLIFMAIPRYN